MDEIPVHVGSPTLSFCILTVRCPVMGLSSSRISDHRALVGGRVPAMDLTDLIYVDAVLHARDRLLSANIRVIGYDFYPNGAGALRISSDDRERAVAALTANGIRWTMTAQPPRAYPPVGLWRSKK